MDYEDPVVHETLKITHLFIHPNTCVYHSIQDDKGHAALNFGKSVDIFKFFGSKGGTSKVAVRQHLRTGEVVDLVYDYDFIVKAERDRWITYVLRAKPKVIIMGPPCTHVGSFSNLNKKYLGFVQGYAISLELAIFAAEMAWIQMTNSRDFLADNHRRVNSGNCHIG